MNRGDGFRCHVCNVKLVEEGGARPFIRVYGYSRKLPTRNAFRDGPTVAIRHGFDPEDARTSFPPVDPVLVLAEEEGEVSFVEHPLCCAALECVAQLVLALRDEDQWAHDNATYTEPTGYVLMRAHR